MLIGVDLPDQLMGYYRIGVKSGGNVCVWKGFKWKEEVLDFRIRWAEALIGEFCSRRSSGRPRTEPQRTTQLDTSQHHLPLYTDSKRDCVVCAGLKRHEGRHRSSIKCKVCDVYLCLDKHRLCFEITLLYVLKVPGITLSHSH